MSRFYFDTTTASDVLRELTGIKNAMDNAKSLMNNVVTSAEANDGFGIFDIIEQLRGEIHSLGKCGLYAESGAKTLSEIINSLDNNAKAVVNVANTFVLAGAEAILSVIMSSENKTDNNVLGNTQQNKPENIQQEKNPLEGYPAGAYRGDDGFVYVKYPNNVLRYDGAGGIGIFKADGTMYDGYAQNQPWWWNTDPNKARVDPSVECTSAALATSSTINGIAKMPDDYNNYSGVTQIGGYRYSSEDITRFCVDNLKLGYSTVIYYNYAGCDGFGANGHAVTVVGADPNPTSIYDLWVIDPVDGQSKPFGQAFGNKSNNFYICYECNPNEYGGAGIKSWDIKQYFGY